MTGTQLIRQRALRCGECLRIVVVQAQGSPVGGAAYLLPTVMPAACQRKGECQTEFEIGMLDHDWWDAAREMRR